MSTNTCHMVMLMQICYAIQPPVLYRLMPSTNASRSEAYFTHPATECRLELQFMQTLVQVYESWCHILLAWWAYEKEEYFGAAEAGPLNKFREKLKNCPNF